MVSLGIMVAGKTGACDEAEPGVFFLQHAQHLSLSMSVILRGVSPVACISGSPGAFRSLRLLAHFLSLGGAGGLMHLVHRPGHFLAANFCAQLPRKPQQLGGRLTFSSISLEKSEKAKNWLLTL